MAASTAYIGCYTRGVIMLFTVVYGDDGKFHQLIRSKLIKGTGA